VDETGSGNSPTAGVGISYFETSDSGTTVLVTFSADITNQI
jgi:hypothetical protein